MAKQIDLAWAAGFFDGEGCVIIQRRKAPKTKHGILHLLHVEVAQVDILPLNKLQKLFKGRIYFDKYSKINKWIITNENARIFISKIQKYTTTKQKECLVALKFSKLIKRKFTGKGHAISDKNFYNRETFYKKLQTIKKEKYVRSK